MPLFGRRLFQLNEDDLSDNNDDEKSIYIIEHTGERFHNRNLYDKLCQIYLLERWTCQCTWRTGLTHKDAYQSEIETKKSLFTIVPEYFHKTIFELLHHNIKPLEKVAEEISIILGQGFVLHEPVQFKKRRDATTVVKGTIERIEENDDQRKRTSERTSVQCRPLSDKQMKNVKYAIRLADEDRVISNVQPNELQRSQLLPNREKLKTFIRSYAIRLGNRADSPWIFYDNSIKEKYQIKDRISQTVIETFQKSMTITLDEILREQERILRKQTEEQATLLGGGNKKSNGENHTTSSQNGHFDDIQILLSDDEEKSKKSPTKKNKSSPKKSSSSNTSPTKKSRSSTKSKKQLTLHEMKFMKNSNKTKSPTTYNVAVPYALLQKLDKTRRDRGIQSKLFQRLILHCARTLNDKQRLRLPEEYRSIVQKKFDELELKRQLSKMTEQEKKNFLQKKNQEKLSSSILNSTSTTSAEDLDISSSKILPLPKQIQTQINIPEQHIGDLLVIYTFFTSCHSLFVSSFNDESAKTTQQFLSSFKLTDLLHTSQTNFTNYFLELLQILVKLLLKEDETRRTNDETNSNVDDEQQQINDQQDPSISTNSNEQILPDDHIEQVYDIKLTEIPLTQFTCPEMTRLYLSKEKDSINRHLLEKLGNVETKDLLITEQIDLLLLLVNQISTNVDIMSDYFEYLNRTVTETSRERNQLLAERRKAQEEDSKEKKLQLQNSEPKKNSSKKSKLSSKINLGIINDENHQSSPSNISYDNDEIDSGGDDDLKTITQRRRQMVAMSKELKEKRELQAQKLQNEQKRDLAIEKAEQAYQNALFNLQFGFRIKPLGFDRYYNRYWFFRGHAGLFVEKGWIGSNINYSVQISSTSGLVNGERLIPRDEPNQWWTYDSETIIEQLVQSLNDRGIREHELLVNLKKILPILRAEFQQTKKENTSMEQTSEEIISNPEIPLIDQSNNDILMSFKNDLEDIEIRLRSGSLGGFIVNDNLIEWQTKLKQSIERLQLAELLIQLQQTVAEKYASGIFGTHENRSKNSKNSSKKKSSSTKFSSNHLLIWMNDCRTCKTYSRLYVLMLIFENAIAWSKSTVGIKCKICRRKTKDEYIVVCDQCCQGYHMDCLRGCASDPSNNSINDLWYCPACRPQSSTRRRGRYEKRDEDEEKKSKVDYYDADIYDMDIDTTSNLSSHVSDFNSEQSSKNLPQDESETINDDYLCSICAGETMDDNELIQCIQCRRLFHCQCHEPPLRCPPRSTTWMCNSCRNGVNNISKRIQTRGQLAAKRRGDDHSRRQSSRQNEIRRTVRKNYREIDEDYDDNNDDDDDDFANNDESDYEEEKRNQRRSKRVRRLSPTSTIDTVDKSDDNFDIRPTRRRVQIARSSSSSSEVTDEEKIFADIQDDDDDDDDDDESKAEIDDEDEQEQENGDIDDISPSSQ